MIPNLSKKFSRSFLKLEKLLPLEKFIPAAFIIFLLCTFILSIITFSNIDQYQNEIQIVNNTNAVLRNIDKLNLEFQEIFSIRRSYIMTGEKKYISAVDSQYKEIKKDISNLKSILPENESETVLVLQLDTIFSKNVTWINSSINNYTSEKDSLKLQFLSSLWVQENLKDFKNTSDKIRGIELESLKEINRSVLTTNKTIQYFILITGIFTFLIIGLSIWISNKLIKNKNVAEQLLMKSYEEMEESVEARTIDLKELNEKLIEEISVREKIENTLRESEQRFRLMADSAPVLIWISDKNKQRTYFNKVWLEFTGRTIEEELGTGWALEVHKDDLKKYFDKFVEAFDQRKEFEMEYRLKNSAGEYNWLIDKGIPRYEGDEFLGYIGSSFEINERKKNETFLKIQYEISKTLADAKTIKEMSQKVLKNICSGINWNFGILWSVDKKDFHALSRWSENENDYGQYADAYDKLYNIPAKGGLLGGVLLEKKSRWIKDIVNDKVFTRKEAAAEIGWNSWLGIPISNGEDVIAIIECFNKNSLGERQDLIEVLESAGRQIGNFIERKKAEEKLIQSYEELEDKVKERTGELASALSRLLDEMEAKEKIQNKIKLFAHTIRSIKDCVYITDLNNLTIFVNNAFENTYGYNAVEITGKEIPILREGNITPNLKEDILKKTLEEGWRGELVTTGKDGLSFYTYLSTSSIRNDEGSIEAIVGICQDITDLKHTEDIINKRNNLLNIINDVIRFTSRAFDMESAIKYSINKVCQYTKSDVGHCYLEKSGLLVSSKIWNDDISDKYEPLKSVSKDSVFAVGEGLPGEVYESGKARWVKIEDILTNPVYKRAPVINMAGLKTGIWVPILMQNDVIGILEFFMKDEEKEDIEVLESIKNIGIELGNLCEKLDTIQKIQKSERFLNNAQHVAKLGSWEWDVINNKITWSDELYLIFELSKESFNPNFQGYMDLIHSENKEEIKSIIDDALKNKKAFTFLHKIETQSGNQKMVKSQGEVYLDEEGNVSKMFGTAHDITEIIRVEEELTKANEKLIETQKELIYNEKLAALGRFSSGVAHEIRNPLANIHSLAQLVLKADLDDKNKKRLKYILTNSDIANNIIRNLLNFASPADLTFSYNDLNEILNNVIESVEARCSEKNIKIFKDIPDSLPILYIDRLKLENAFMNFVSNSIDAMPDGGTLHIRVFHDNVKNVIAIEFTDTGIGIPPENIDKILEPFFTTKDEGVGLGMGLAHQTIKQHQGTFTIKSVEDRGTHIEIKLPLNNYK